MGGVMPVWKDTYKEKNGLPGGMSAFLAEKHPSDCPCVCLCFLHSHMGFGTSKRDFSWTCPEYQQQHSVNISQYMNLAELQREMGSSQDSLP